MIGSIKGQVSHKAGNYLIVDTGSVGYRVFVTPVFLATAKVGQELNLVVYTYVREDQLALYGFASLAELEFFEMLLTVSGVGPKSALGIMSVASLGMIKSAIVSEDPSVFTKVSGIGRKTAERVIIELKDKLKDQASAAPVAKEHSEALDALMALGYSQQEAREALKNIATEKTLQEKIKLALKVLGK